MAVSFHSWRNKLFLWVNQQPSVSNWQLPLIVFEPEPQRRGASSFKARHLNPLVTEAPGKLRKSWNVIRVISYVTLGTLLRTKWKTYQCFQCTHLFEGSASLHRAYRSHGLTRCIEALGWIRPSDGGVKYRSRVSELYSGHVKEPGLLWWNYMYFCIWILSLLSFPYMHDNV